MKIIFKQNSALLAGLIAAIGGLFLISACNKKTVGPTSPDPGGYMSIAQFRPIFQGPDTVVPARSPKFRGVVISNNANESAGSFRIEDESGRGMYLYSSGTSFALNSLVEINPSGAVITKYKGDMELAISSANVLPIVLDSAGAVSRIPLKTTTVAEAIDSLLTYAANDNTLYKSWTSMLVTIPNVTIASSFPGSTGTNYYITDASVAGTTKKLTSFVRSTSGIALQSGTYSSITGYLSLFGTTGIPTPQLSLRLSSDAKH